MPTCPKGHDTQATDFCEVCGIRVGGAPAPTTATAPTGARAASGHSCPRCGTDASGQFCEVCGYSLAAAQATPERGRVATAPGYVVGAPAPGATAGNGNVGAWTAVVTADRAY